MFNLDDLVCAVFERAIEDAKADDAHSDSAKIFLAPSGWARFLLESLGVDPDLVHWVGSLVYG